MQRMLRQLRFQRGLVLLGEGITILAIVLGIIWSIDSLWRPRESVSRLVLSFMFWGLILLSFVWRWMRYPPVTWRDACAYVESELGLEFGKIRVLMGLQMERHSGSEELTRHAIADAERLTGSLPIEDLIRTRDLFGRYWIVGVAVGILLLVALFKPAVAYRSSVRGANPFSDLDWPRSTKFELLRPNAAVPQGADVDLIFANRFGDMPRDVAVAVRNSAGTVEWLSAKRGVRLASSTVPNVQSDFSVRAVGGDDSEMAWHIVRVMPPTELEQFAFQVQPPSFTGLPQREVFDSKIRVLDGSGVQLEGRFSQPVRDIELIPVPADLQEQVAAPEPEEELIASLENLDVQLLDNGARFIVGHRVNGQLKPLSVRQRTRFQLVWTSKLGLRQAAREYFEIDVETDQPPIARWIQPSSRISITEVGSFPFHLVAEDDFGFKGLALEISSLPLIEEERIKLPLLKQGELTSDLGFTLDLQKNRVEATGRFAPRESYKLAAPQVLEIRMAVTDVASQSVFSRSLTIDVLTVEEFKKLLATKQQRILEQLRIGQASVVRASQYLQQASGEGVEGESLATAVSEATKANTTLLSGTSSALALIEALLDECNRNQIVAPFYRTVLPEILQLMDGELRPALGKAILALTRNPADGELDRTQQQDAAARFTQARELLEKILRLMDQQSQQQELVQLLRFFAQEQEDLLRKTRQLGVGSEGESVVSAQNELARAFDRELALFSNDALTPSVQAASQKWLASSIAPEMRDAGGLIQRRSISQANRLQQKIIDTLQKGVASLQGNVQSEPSSDGGTEREAAGREWRDDLREFLDVAIPLQESISQQLIRATRDNFQTDKATLTEDRELQPIRELQQVRKLQQESRLRLQELLKSSPMPTLIDWLAQRLRLSMAKLEAMIARDAAAARSLSADCENRLDALAIAMNGQTKSNANSEEAVAGSDQQKGGLQDGLSALEAIQILRSTQEDIRQRVVELKEESVGQSGISSTQVKLLLRQLGEEQIELADFFTEFMGDMEADGNGQQEGSNDQLDGEPN